MESHVVFSAWLEKCKIRALENSSGAFGAKDAKGVPVLCEWLLTDIQAPECVELKRQIADLGCQAVVPVELEFLRARPDAVLNDGFLRACVPLFLQGLAKVDWDAVRARIDEVLRQIYTVEVAQFGPEVVQKLAQDVLLFITIKNVETDELLGFISCGVTPASAQGEVKVITCAVVPEAKDRGLEKMLFASIFKAFPDATRLFLGTRPTNAAGIEEYKSLGFTVCEMPTQDPNHQVNLKNWVVMEYQTSQSSQLKNVV